jgi:hypothetical protein
MDRKESQTVLGYSVFEKFEECYQYNENACFIADTKDSAQTFLKNGYGEANDCRIDAVTFGDIMLDFGASCGEYAMENRAYSAFTRIAKLNNVTFTSEPYDGDETLLVVQVDGVR